MLGMSDPNFKAEEEGPPPPQPPRRTQPQSQMEADELYARQLNEHFNAPRYQQRPGEEQGPPLPRRPSSPSFFDGKFMTISTQRSLR